MGNRAKSDREKIIKLVEKGLKPKEIATTLNLPVQRVYNVQARARAAGELIKHNDIIKDLDNYEPQLINNIKSISLEVSNTLLNKTFQKESSTQLAKTLGILIDKLRLIEGKSTQNISAQIVHNLNSEQLKILEEMGKSLIISMLNKNAR